MNRLDILPVNKVTVTEQIIKQIADLIVSGTLKPGQKLPNERDLAEQFGVTRSRIREALRALSLIGMIQIRAGEGSFVRGKEDSIPDHALEWIFHEERNSFDELYAARKLIEMPIYCLATQTISEWTIEELQQIIDMCRIAVYENKNPLEFVKCINDFDNVVAKATGNSIVAKLMEIFTSIKEEANIRLTRIPGSMENSYLHRMDQFEALKSGDVMKVKHAVTNALESAKPFYTEMKEKDS
jgi:GntR family transcriptional repressor for pyruvate dehydrogenase complex